MKTAGMGQHAGNGRPAIERRELHRETLRQLQTALRASSYSYTSGSTHTFYHYPARFSPHIARATIGAFSEPGGWVLDPFMGGGTAIIEGLTLRRQMVGVDINALACFIADVRTTPLARRSAEAVRQWAMLAAAHFGGPGPLSVDDRRAPQNLPRAFGAFMAGALALARRLPSNRERRFARCVLLRLGQWALDCRDVRSPRRQVLAAKLPELTDCMLAGLQDFERQCRAAGVRRPARSGNRILLCRSVVGLEEESRLRSIRGRVGLVFTSPPYPGVHVLYHRWQYRGRRETAAPYWIASVPDGYYESHYTGGSRTVTGQERYFAMITSAFRSIRQYLARNALVVQLVGFADTATQLPRFLAAMEEADFRECNPAGAPMRPGRLVPNRKWYAKLRGASDAASEMLIFHRIR
jgi:hypothetical protein